MAAKNVSVDSGKFATKAVMKDKSGIIRILKFRTKMDETKEEVSENSKSYVVQYNGKRYLIGEEAEQSDYETSKAKEIHKLCTYLAVSQLVENDADINLIIGCPIDIYYNVEERKEYGAYMKGNGNVNLLVNNIQKNFHISNVMVCPEGSGVLYQNPAKYKDDIVGIIDIGGLNVNGCVYGNLIARRNTYFTNSMGANVFRNELRQLLNSTIKGANIQEYLMDKVIKDGFIRSNKEESQKIISEFKKRHLNNILAECVKKGWDLNNMDIIFVGGGSAMLSTEIVELGYELATAEKNIDMENVLGFLTIGGVKYA